MWDIMRDFPYPGQSKWKQNERSAKDWTSLGTGLQKKKRTLPKTRSVPLLGVRHLLERYLFLENGETWSNGWFITPP